ncbi:MAG: PEP-CTERM sorting domain-containing protein [Candidatus Methylacidiphilales bacterium]|nr:PEP-CTERM sorting domain-containing protein [Candidatus Methylacidiphilales bacterium]
MKTKKLSVFSIALGLVLISGAITPLQSAVIITSNFESPTFTGSGGGTALSGQGSWSSAGDWVVYNTSPLTYSNGTVTNNGGSQNASLRGWNPTAVANISFTSQTAQNLYFSYLFNYTNPNGDTDDFMRFQFNNAAGNAGSSNYLAMQYSNNQINARVRGASAPSAVAAGSALTSGQTYMVVGKLTWDGSAYNQIDLWVNPNVGTEPTLSSQYLATATASGANTGLNNINAFTMFAGASSAQYDTQTPPSDVVRFDNFTLGTTYADVVTVIPEPSSYALVAGGLISLLALRRMKKNP